MICITGGAGFIGLNFTKYLLDKVSEKIVVIDNLTYASNPTELGKLPITFCNVGIHNKQDLRASIDWSTVSTIFHFAAETHVDRSIESSDTFIQSNIIGTVNLLDIAVEHGIRFIHISTDEVFGDINDGFFTENSKYNPRNPYSASKASAEHFVNAYWHTHGLNFNIINSSNNYGPYQHKEKLIPKAITNLLNDVPVPIYGAGNQIRDWVYVTDTCEAIYAIYTNGQPHARYCIGGNNETKNLELVTQLCDLLEKPRSLITHVPDRLGHDIRYATSIEKIQNELNWYPKVSLIDGLKKTINFYKNNEQV